MKIAINNCFGGWGLSDKCINLIGKDYYYNYLDELPLEVERCDKKLIQAIEELGDEASAGLSRVRVIEIPDEATHFRIEDYDGYESVLYAVDGKIYCYGQE